MFDLQKFADDDKDYSDVLDGADETTDDVSEIPAELEGIPEDIAREVMQKSDAEKPPENPTPTDNVSVPYARFKEVNDKKNETEKLLVAYRERYGDLQSAPQQNFSQPQQPPPQFQPPAIDENFSKQIDDAITQMAMQMSGLSKEDVEALEYADDDDPKVARWNHAKKLSEATVYNDVINRHNFQQQQFQRETMLRNQTLENYNNYVAQQQAADNFAAVQRFAENEFFNAQSDIDKQIILESYARINQNLATPADFLIVRNYFSTAKTAFENGQNPTPQKKSKPAPNNFPRTNQISGTTGSGGVSQAALADMLRNKAWNKIPPNYQKMLLGI